MSYNSHVIDLDKLAQIFNLTFDSMSSIEMSLMETHIKSINKVLSPGLTTLNWSSQRISVFIAAAFHALEKFRSTLTEVRKHSLSIQNIVWQIEQDSLVDVEYDCMLTSLADLTGVMETRARKKLSKRMQQYKSISPLLIKIEMAVSESDKGVSILLKRTYNYWSKRVHNALIEMTFRSIFSFFAILRAPHSKSSLCQINITVCEKEIVMDPTLSEIQKYINRCIRMITETSLQFSRWMHQTCLDAATNLELNDDALDGKLQCSFYKDISRNSAITSSLIGLNHGISLLMKDLHIYLQHWKLIFNEHRVFDSRWMKMVDTNVQSDIPTSLFDGLIKECNGKLFDIESTPFKKGDVYVDLCQQLCVFRSVDVTHAKRFLIEAITERKMDIGDALHTIGKQNLESIQDRIENHRHTLCPEPKSFDELKTVINGVITIQNSNMTMEFECKDICERYQVMRDGDICIPQEEISQAFASSSHWHNLLIHAKTIDLRLADFKDDFKQLLIGQSADFMSKLKMEKSRYLQEGPGSSMISLDQGLVKFDEWTTNLALLRSRKEELTDSEDILGMTNTMYGNLSMIEGSMNELDQIYLLYNNLNEIVQAQQAIIWLSVDIDSFDKKLDFLDHKSKNIPTKYNKSTWDKVNSRIVGLKNTIPILKNLRTDSIKGRHWEQLAQMTNSPIQSSFEDLTLFQILTMNIHRIPSEVDEIVNSSVQEQKIENSLLDVTNYWRSANLITRKYKSGTNSISILSSMDELVIQLEDHILNLHTMLGSKFAGEFRDEIKDWEKRLNLVIECIHIWFRLQQKWMYLEIIFVEADDIRIQLPKEAKIFDDTSRAFQLIMKKTNEVPNIVNACSQERMQTFTYLLEALENCQKSLSEYLNTKRAAFSRFYFISDEEMISILGNSDPSFIEPHLMKLFDNTKKLQFSQGNTKILGLSSSEEEHFQLIHEVDSVGPVEVWMKHLEGEIEHTLHSKMKESIFNFATQSRKTWIEMNVGMCIMSASQVWWTWQVEDAFQLIEIGEKRALQDLEIKLSTELSNMITMVRSPLHANTRRKVNSSLIIDVHARDVVSSFVRESILSSKEFAWESQLRFYWNKSDDDLLIRQCIGSFYYGYEYIGLSGRLVMTPLTDRCFMTLTQALTFKLGGSPSGPAGTGKVSFLMIKGTLEICHFSLIYIKC